MEFATEARGTADRLARAAGIEVRPLSENDDLQRLSDVIDDVWGRSTPMIEFGMLKAFVLAGGYVVGAFDGSKMIGGAVAFLGRHDVGGEHLHSHVAGFVEPARGNGRGRALKMDQRAWCLERGIATVEWTFDPLVRRNAWFNLQRLGVDVARYEVNFYGDLRDDAINGADESDRLVAVWNLASDRSRAAAADQLDEPETSKAMIVGVPEDIVAIRQRDAAEARRCRLAVRNLMHPAMAEGAAVVGMTRDGNYVLRGMR